MLTKNRHGRRGGGVALVIKDNIKFKEIDIKESTSFELGAWQLNLGSNRITLIVVYRPPNLENTTLINFTDEFSIHYM